MKKNYFLSLAIMLIATSLLSQDFLSKKEMKLYHKIWGVALDSFLHSKSTHFVLFDSTENISIRETDFLDYVHYMRLTKNPGLDSSWLLFLEDADEKKSNLLKIKLSQIKSIHTIRLFNRDTFFAKQATTLRVGAGIVEPYGWVAGYARISTPILSKKKDKAIVVIGFERGILNGNGGFLLLERKRNGKWVSIKYVQTWVS